MTFVGLLTRNIDMPPVATVDFPPTYGSRFASTYLSDRCTCCAQFVQFFEMIYMKLRKLTDSMYNFKTCRSIRQVVDERSVWLAVFLDLLRVKPSVYSYDDIATMSSSQLREASRRTVQVDRAFSSPIFPHHEAIILPSVDLASCADVTLLPGGERVLVLRNNAAFEVYDIASGNIVFSAPEIEGLQVARSFARLYPTSMSTGCILVYGTA